MKQKSFEQFLKEEIRVDRLTPLQYSGILRAQLKYEIQTEHLHKLNVVRGGDKVRESVKRVEEYLDWLKGDDTLDTPTEPLPAEGQARGVCDGCGNYKLQCRCLQDSKDNFLSYLNRV